MRPCGGHHIINSADELFTDQRKQCFGRGELGNEFGKFCIAADCHIRKQVNRVVSESWKFRQGINDAADQHFIDED